FFLQANGISSMSSAPSPASTEDIGYTSTFFPIEAAATLLTVGVGLLYWFCIRSGRVYSPTASFANAEPYSAKPREERFAAFVKHELSANETVLFAGRGGRIEPFRALYDALQVPLHVVDLTQMAGGSKVLEALHERHPEQVENVYLFLKGHLVGGLKQLRGLLVDGRKDELGEKCDWSHVRVDTKSDTGFMILSALNSFQCAGEINQEGANFETKPLHTVDELRAFDPKTLVRCCVPIAPLSRKQRRRSKLLVCHDMKGGYHEDRFKQGCDNFDAYRFYQWDLVDLFVYFGHALVCPPPSGWIAAGHRHGTRVLGTFLTEGDEGTELCKELFKDAQSAEIFASKLADITRHGGFDGWLINVENDVPAALVANIDGFLRTLRKALQLQNPLAQVVWYGSLSRSGKRSSYVRLDEASTEFFRNVDGFYADYGWTPDDAKFSAAFDLDRRYDVYMGIDVFGRHDMLGGGKMNCGEPLRLAWNAGVSAALFAPGWTYECYQHEEQQDFVVVENHFWNAVRESWKARSPCYDALGGQNCLYTAFNVGRGVGVWSQGERVGNSAWSNMTELDVQPDQALHAGNVVTTATGSMKAVISHDTAFHGGASAQIQGQLDGREKSYFKLFDVDIEFSPRRIMEISYTTATRDESVCLLVLTVCPGLDRATHFVILRSMDDSEPDIGEDRMGSKKTLSTVAKATSEKHFYLPVSTEFFHVEGVNADAVQGIIADGWCKKTYRLGGQLWDQKHIVEIGVLCTKKIRKVPGEHEDYLAYIGEICVVGSTGKPAVRAAHRGVHSQPQCCENARITSFKRNDVQSVSFGLQWGFTSDGEPMRYVLAFACIEDGERVFVGRSFDDTLWVDKYAWQRREGDKATRLTLELRSVSWAGQSSTAVCQLHFEE
ncbi:Glycosyl hydrolase family 85, partial [Phytophthora infestans]